MTYAEAHELIDKGTKGPLQVRRAGLLRVLGRASGAVRGRVRFGSSIVTLIADTDVTAASW